MPENRYEDLVVWKLAHQFVLMVFDFCNRYGKTEFYGITSEFKRRAISIPKSISGAVSSRDPKEKKALFSQAREHTLKCIEYLQVAEGMSSGETEELKTLLCNVNELLETYVDNGGE
jgi:four helix bundle protein